MTNHVEVETSEALLDIGVSIPLKTWRIPLTRKTLSLRLTMRRPKLGNQIRIARKYLSLGTTYEQMQAFTKEESMAFLANHGKTIAEMVALTICRGKVTGLLSGLLAWVLTWMVDDTYLMAANLHFVSLMGSQNFTNIIRSSEWSNPLRPRLSRDVKGS